MAKPAKPQYKAESTPKPPQSKSPVEIANIMAGAAVKKLQMNKSYKQDDNMDPMDLKDDQGPPVGDHGNSPGGAKSPSLKKTGGPGTPSIDGSTYGDEDVEGGAEHPSIGKPNRSKSQIAAIKAKSKAR